MTTATTTEALENNFLVTDLLNADGVAELSVVKVNPHTHAHRPFTDHTHADHSRTDHAQTSHRPHTH